MRPPGEDRTESALQGATAELESIARAIAASPAACPPAAGGIVVWQTPSAHGDLVLDPWNAGPLLAPAGVHGAILAAALLEALDQSAASARTALEIKQSTVSLKFHRSADWPAPRRAPSEVLGGRANAPPPGWSVSPTVLAARRRLEQAQVILGEPGLAAIREFPARRRLLVEERRRAERRFWSLEEALRVRRRKSAVFLSIAAAGLVAAGAAIPLELGAAAATGAMLFALGAAGVAVQARARWCAERKRSLERAAVADVMRREEELEQELRRLTARVESIEPWRLADEVALLRDDSPSGARTDEEQAVLLAIALPLAKSLGLDGAALEDRRPWSASGPRATAGWPWEVTTLAGPGELAVAVAGMAKLLERVERDLPVPWPIVLWEPWPGAPAEERARRLMALSRAAPRRAIIAVVGA